MTIGAPAPSGGALVTFTRDNELLTVPQTVTIPAGATSAGFDASAGEVETSAVVILTAAFADSSLSFTFNLQAPAILSGLECAKSELTAGASSVCTVTLAGPAPEPGVEVELAVSGPFLFIPASVTVPGGSDSATFSATASAVSEEESAVIVAALSGRSAEYLLTVAPPKVSTVALVRMNAGGPAYVDSLGQQWIADTNSDGYVSTTEDPVTGSADPALYMSERWTDSSTLEYRFKATPGKYNVRLKFAEIFFTEPGHRVFHILINGAMAAENFDVVQAAAGPFKAVDVNFPAVSEGEILIQLVSVLQHPKVNAIEITGSDDSECPCSIWSGNGTPEQIDSASTPAIEVGMKFRARQDGFVTGIRFYKGPENVGLHTGSLWTSGGALLASVYFMDETKSGWQHADFANPVPVEAGVTYVVSYHAPYGHHSQTRGGFSGATLESGPLQALKDGEDGPNGLYRFGAGFPVDSFAGTNYWVDVVFMPEPETEPGDTASGLLENEPAPPSLSVSCTPALLRAGDEFNCQIRREGDASHESVIALRTTNSNIRVPAWVLARANQRVVTFRGTVDEGTAYSTVRIIAGNGDHPAYAQVSIAPHFDPALSLPGRQLVRPGEPLRFTVAPRSAADGVVPLTAEDLPAGAVFHEESNWFEWIPEIDQQRQEEYVIHFQAGETEASSADNRLRVQVESGKPLITEPVQIVCSPGAIATVHGRWLSHRREALYAPDGLTTDLAGVKVLLNRVIAYGTPLPVLFASQTRVDFLCPNATGQDFLSLVIQTEAGDSAPHSIRSSPVHPALLPLQGDAGDHGFATHAESGRLVILRDARSLGEPAQPRDKIVIRASGLGSAQPEAGSLSIEIGDSAAEILKVVRDDHAAGVFLIHVRVPDSVPAGDKIPVRLRALSPGAVWVTSNKVEIPVESSTF
ncbi:MAG: DUF4082 domain-containing protein [Bryobacteraceae bacterium]|nr:DUF4082 domain-containing protein [Bryobacteraceae bacterium]